MPAPTPVPHNPRLHGLNPLALANVLSEARDSRPDIPGWEIGAPLGEGGLGTVWKARRISDQTAAAIKVPRSDDVAMVERLEGEVEALRALDHPHIVRLLESGPLEDGSLYLAMEYVDGPVLSQAIPASGFHATGAYGLFRQVAAAVVHAHSRGVLHRDLKPGNILLDASGHARVADFGLAHSIHERVQRLSLTVTGLIAGTAEYLPPEAYRAGYEPDVSADIYALGVILHELLTGHPPRGAWQPVSLTKKDVDIRVDDLLRRALDPDPTKRFPAVKAMLDEFERILRSPARYAGTPRVTRAVRFMDFVWTVFGLFLFLGAFGVMARIEKYGFGLPVDLIGSETTRIGTYQAILILLVVAAPACLWQIFRLWHFRAVPLREALPSPFGVRLESSRTAAVAVALAQFLCVLLPAYFGAQAWREKCMKWLTPDDPPWAQGFVLTEGIHGTVLLDPWAWPEEGKTYSLRDRSGGLTHALGYNLDHTNFWPGYLPRLVAGLALLYGATVALTFLSALARWWRFRKWSQAAALLTLTLFSARAVRADIIAWDHATMLREANTNLSRVLFDDACQTIGQVLNALAAGTDPLRDHAPQFADTVLVNEKPCPRTGPLPAALDALAAAFGSPHRRLQFYDQVAVPGLTLGTFHLCQVHEDCTDPPDGPSTGALTILAASGDLHYDDQGLLPDISITSLTTASAPLWTASARPLPPDAAAAWVQTFLTGLSTAPFPGQPDPLTELFLPQLLTRKARTEWLTAPAVHPLPRAELLTTLRPAGSTAAALRLLAPPGPAAPLPGGRQRITFTFRDHRDTATWHADLVFCKGRWQCAQLLTR